MAGYNHSQEYLGQNLGLGPLVRQAFTRSTLYVSARVRRNALSNTQLFKVTFDLEKLKNVCRRLVSCAKLGISKLIKNVL